MDGQKLFVSKKCLHFNSEQESLLMVRNSADSDEMVIYDSCRLPDHYSVFQSDVTSIHIIKKT